MKLRNISPVFVFMCMGMVLMTLSLAFLTSTMAKAALFLLSIVIIGFAVFMSTRMFKKLKKQEDMAFPERRY